MAEGKKEVNAVSSIVRMRCPYCGKGKLFINNNPYKLGNKKTMHAECPVCKKSFSPEPGFYFGAAYVSYALSVIVGCIAWLLLILFRVNAIGITLTMIIAAVMGVSPITYRLSRSLWIGIHAGLQKSKE